MKLLFNITTLKAATMLCAVATAQSDPPLLAGTWGAANSAINYGVMSKYTGGAPSSCEEKTQWKAYMAKRGDCRRAALDVPAGKQRRAARDRCDAMYPATESPNCRR
jgi:hypothetical protein